MEETHMSSKKIRLTIGEKLKDLRAIKGGTQIEAANAVGISDSSISNYENDVTFPKIDVLVKLLKYYGASLNELLIDCYGVDESELEGFKKIGLSENFMFYIILNKIGIAEKYDKYSVVDILNMLFEEPYVADQLFESLSLFFNYNLRRDIMKNLPGAYDFSQNAKSHERYGQIFMYGIAEALELIYKRHFYDEENAHK
jgi:transcriptional regulator with XRE-family HTH domain